MSDKEKLALGLIVAAAVIGFLLASVLGLGWLIAIIAAGMLTVGSVLLFRGAFAPIGQEVARTLIDRGLPLLLLGGVLLAAAVGEITK